MSGALKQKQRVHTNTMKDSVCKVDVPPIKFAQLWENYVTGNPYDDPSGTHPNQCAIRMSATLHRVGIEMKSFSQNTVKPAPGKATLGRILLDGKPTATRANEMAAWLKLQPFCGLPNKPENITGKEWESKVKGRTGIIFFDGYWTRAGESAETASGGHIDLWNGTRLTISSAVDGFATVGRYLGIRSFRQGANFASELSYSDLNKAKTILFWEIQ